MSQPPYDLNVHRWLDDHPGWQLCAGPGGFGWKARPSFGPGAWVHGSTLDELAARVAEAKAASGG